MRTIAAAIAVGVLLSTAGCGGHGEGEAGGPSEAVRAIQPEAQERAEALVLTLTDFPDGWRAGPADESDDNSEEGFRRCVGTDFSGLTLIAETDSDSFAIGDTAEAGSSATVFESAQMATDALEAQAASLESDEADACMSEYIGNPELEDVTFGEIEVSPLSFTPPSDVDDARAWQVVIPIEVTSDESEDVTVTAYLDVVALREGDTIATVQTFDLLTPLDQQLRDDLVAAVAGRMTTSSGSQAQGGMPVVSPHDPRHRPVVA